MLKAKSMCDFFFLGGGVRKYITCVGRLVVVYQCVCKDRKAAVRRKQGAPAVRPMDPILSGQLARSSCYLRRSHGPRVKCSSDPVYRLDSCRS